MIKPKRKRALAFRIGGRMVVVKSVRHPGSRIPADAAATRSNLGLGDSATKSVGTTAGKVAAGDHTHDVYNLASMMDKRVKAWVLSQVNMIPGSAVIDSGNTASAVAYYNYTSTSYPLTPLSKYGDARSVINFDRTHEIAMEVALFNASGSGVGWFVVGEAYNASTVGDPSKKGFGFKLTASGIALWVHNGTTLTVGAATAFAADEALRLVKLKYTGGTLTGTLDGVALSQVTGGPTGNSIANNNAPSFQAKTGATNERVRWAAFWPSSATY